MAHDHQHGKHEPGHLGPMHEPAHHDQGDYMRNPGGAHEHRDINVRAIFGFLIVLTVMAFAVQLGLWGMFKYLKGEYVSLDPEPNPMLSGRRRPPESDPIRDFPQPRLQADAVRDLNKMRQAEDMILNGPPVWLDEQNGIVRIPIERAMQLTVERGLPQAPAPPAPRERGARR